MLKPPTPCLTERRVEHILTSALIKCGPERFPSYGKMYWLTLELLQM